MLVVPAPKKEFELTITKTGQLREFLNIAYSMGIKKLIVVVNKMDATSPPYSQVRSQQRVKLDLWNRLFYVWVFFLVFFSNWESSYKHYKKINLRQTVWTLLARVSNRSKLLPTSFTARISYTFLLSLPQSNVKIYWNGQYFLSNSILMKTIVIFYDIKPIFFSLICR